MVLSVTSNSALRHTLAKMKGSLVFPLGPLSMPDRKEIVHRELAVYGKKLSDTAFNNQVGPKNKKMLKIKHDLKQGFIFCVCVCVMCVCSYRPC